MDVKALDNALALIVEKKNLLNTINYNDEAYDEIEEALHDLEDDFGEKYGDYIEDALHEIHDEYCPDSDVLLPIAYLANRYIELDNDNEGSKSFDVEPEQGVIVDVDDYPGNICRLVLVPGPTRILLQIGKNKREEVWKAK